MASKSVSMFYNVLNTTIDKSKVWYNVANNIIYVKADANGFKYYLEADTYDPNNGRQLYIILSREKIHDSCRQCYVDNFGRLKIKPVAHKEYFKTMYERDSNIKFELVDVNSDYSSFII